MVPLPVPSREEAAQLVEIYFQQANPQFPILFRPTFNAVFRRVLDSVERDGRAITPPVYLQKEAKNRPDRVQHSADLYFAFMCFAIASAMSQDSGDVPDRYHASAMKHIECLFMSASFPNNRLDGLKGVLLLALYSLMRPCIPGRDLAIQCPLHSKVF